MNITVCIKQVPSTSEVAIDEKTGNLIRDGVESKINPYDLFAIEEAVSIKESLGASINAITMGPPQAEDILQEAFTLGVDGGYLVTDRKCAGADVLATAKALSEGIKKAGDYDLVICGKQTTDGDTAQVGAEIAELLGIPHANNVLEIKEIKKDSIVLDLDLPTMVQTVEIQFPCLISLEKDINQPRLPSYKLKKENKDKQVTILGVKDFEDKDEMQYGMNGSPTQVVRMFPPEANDETEVWEGNAEELSEKLSQKIMELKIV